MKRPLLTTALLVAVPLGWWLRAQIAAVVPPLASNLPPGALVYLEAKDFGKLLGEWNNSTEKAKWVGSPNYAELSRSRLIGRLQQAQGEFEKAAGVSPEMKLLQQVAGTQSAFAFYNIGALKFVYLTHIGHQAIESGDLWKQRAQYQPREAAGIAFYIKQDQGTGRTLAFATKDDVFVMTTDESLMASTLALLAGQPAPSLAKEEWFETLTTGKPQGDLRLVYDLRTTAKTPQFRTYWIQENETELKEYATGVSDLFETSAGFEEHRILVRAQQSAAPAASSDLASLVSTVTPGDSLYRAWSRPTKNQLSAALRQVIYGDAPPPNPFVGQTAPQASAEFSHPSYSPSLETHINQPPVSKDLSKPIDAVLDAITAMDPTALLHVQSTVALPDGVFVVPESAVLIACAHADATAAQTALRDMLGAALESGGLDPLIVRVQGNVLELMRGQGLIGPSSAQAPSTTEIYAAGYNHAAEWPKYTRLFRLLDTQTSGGPQGTPAFFSTNVQSLGDALSRLQRASLERTDNGNGIAETVTYEMK
ncbi:MAG: hypothetical protein WA324_16935 [Bryobacteraceae bacterium]